MRDILTHASLFSGIGGPEVAAAMLGFRNAFHCEINPFGRAVLDYWFPESKSYEDITKTDFRPWRGQIDILTAGFPCQPFSYAGKRGGAADERYLWPEAFRAINEIRPTWFVGENVAGVATMVEGGVLTDMGWEGTLFGEVEGVHRYGLRQSFTIERICRDLENIGYSVQPVLIPAAAVGAPHRRDRIFFLAHLDDTDDNRTVRIPGENEGARAQEGLSQRNEVQFPQLATDARPKMQGAAPDTHGDRGGEIHKHVQPGFPDGSEPFGDGRKRPASHADRQGREEPQQPRRGEDSPEEEAGLDDRTVRPCRDESFADTYASRLSAAGKSRVYDEEERHDARRPAGLPSYDAWAEGSWWDNFPTVSPVHAGNDGLSFRMDRAALPFGKWRTEALKAYGNAIVPQVMYRIFQAILKNQTL